MTAFSFAILQDEVLIVLKAVIIFVLLFGTNTGARFAIKLFEKGSSL